MDPDLQSAFGRRNDEIVELQCFPVHLPLIKPITTATHQLSFGSSLYVRVRTRGGAEGWGESGADGVMAGETLPGMIAMIEHHLKPRLMSRSPFDRRIIMREWRNIYGNGGAKAAVEMALIDLAGKLCNLPAVDILGGAARRSATVLRIVGGAGIVKSDVDEAVMLRDEGFKAFKFKVGVTTVEQEAETVGALRSALGPGVSISADANMAWNVAQTRRFLRLAEPFGLEFLEQPVAAGDPTRMVDAGANTGTILGADESIHGTSDILVLARNKAIGGLSLKAAKFSGPTSLLMAGAMADALGLSVNVAMLVESKLASMAMLHTACALPQIDWGLSLGYLWLAQDPSSAPFQIDNGEVRCPDTIGLGVVVDEKALRRMAPT